MVSIIIWGNPNATFFMGRAIHDDSMSKTVRLLFGNSPNYIVRPDGFSILEALKIGDEERNDAIQVEYSTEPDQY